MAEATTTTNDCEYRQDKRLLTDSTSVTEKIKLMKSKTTPFNLKKFEEIEWKHQMISSQITSLKWQLYNFYTHLKMSQPLKL